MPNANYVRGRAFEYKRMRYWKEERGYPSVSRTGGSHGLFDIYALHPHYPVMCIQCKVVEDEATAKRLIKDFQENPPILSASGHFHQALEVYVKKTREVLTTVL